MTEAATNDAINICGVLVHAIPNQVSRVEKKLLQLEGVEVHTITDDGRLVITIDHPDRFHMVDTINQLNAVEGVLSAAMVYQHSEQLDEN